MIIRISIFYVLTWFFLVLLGGLQGATGILPPEIGLAQWGPGIAALLMLVLFRRDGFSITFFPSGSAARRYFWAAGIPLGAGLFVYLIRALIPMTSTVPEIFANLPLVLLWMPLGALGEELGWRGYLHKKLDPHMRGLVSSVVVGLLWMPIHVHFLGQGPLFLSFFLLTTIAWSIVMYALVQDTGFSVLLATLFHWAINLINLLTLDVVFETAFMLVNALVWGLVAVYFVRTRKELYLGAKQD